MILKIKTNLYQIVNLIFLLYLAYIPNLYAHNLINGGCKDHCDSKIKAITNKNKLKNVYDQMEIENNNSCLNKALCRG